MTELTPAQRTLRARMAAYALHAKYDPRETTAKARQAFADKFYDATDLNLPEAERRRRAEMLMRQHMAALQYRSSVARSKRTRHTPTAPAAAPARRDSREKIALG